MVLITLLGTKPYVLFVTYSSGFRSKDTFKSQYFWTFLSDWSIRRFFRYFFNNFFYDHFRRQIVTLGTNRRQKTIDADVASRWPHGPRTALQSGKNEASAARREGQVMFHNLIHFKAKCRISNLLMSSNFHSLKLITTQDVSSVHGAPCKSAEMLCGFPQVDSSGQWWTAKNMTS